MVNKETLTRGFKKINLRELPFALFKLEKRIYHLIKQGESLEDNNNQLKKAKYKRNMVRFILLNKLLRWKTDPDKEKDWTHSEILRNEERKKYREQEKLR